MSRRKEPVIPAEILDQLLAGTDAAAALDQGGLLDVLKKALAERALNAEMDYHLGDNEQAGNRLQLFFTRHLNRGLGIAQAMNGGIQTDKVVASLTRSKV